MVALIDITGKRFGRLEVASRAENTTKGQAQWLCRCDCGNSIVVASIYLRKGKTTSCGCWKKEFLATNRIVHGHSSNGKKTSTYQIWRGMHQRCGNPRHHAYKNYGGRGITVCDRWNSFENFLEDMGEKPEGRSIDRIDNDRGYNPDNCRWATATEQARNKRNSRKDHHLHTLA